MEDVQGLREQARQALRRGDSASALNALTLAAAQTHLAENDYVSVLNLLGEALMSVGDHRGALTVAYYFLRSDPSRLSHVMKAATNVLPSDRARALAAFGDTKGAAREAERGQLLAASAIYREKSDDYAGARAMWSRLGQSMGGRADAYVSALVAFNLSRSARKCNDLRQARDAKVASVRLLEEAADHFETIGQRERAFDCFQVLVQIGKETGSFEDLLEGYVNCIRILREDHLKYFALQYFDEALKTTEGSGEYSAAATLAREASEYARSLGMNSAALHYVVTQGDLWKRQADKHLERKAPAEIAENALLAAVLSFGELGQYGRVGELYRSLARLELEATRQAHYARASRRYDGLRNEPLDATPLPSHLRQEQGFPDVWHVDVLEWEQGGSAAEAAADVLLDLRWPDLIRRKALLARLTAFVAESGQPGPTTVNAQIKLAGQLAQLQLYNVLSPLEHLYEVREPQVKVAVLRALRTLFFKRSFVTIRTALKQNDASLVPEIAETTKSLYFLHAFDPLARIVRETNEPRVRAGAIAALAKIDTEEAAEFLLGLIEHGSPQDREAARVGASEARGNRFLDLARANLGAMTAEAREVVRNVLRNRGIAA